MPKKKHDPIGDAGRIVSLFSGVARVIGLSRISQHEMLVTASGKESGIVIGFDGEAADVLLFDETPDTAEPLYGSGSVFSINVSNKVLGRIFNGAGQPIDGKEPITGTKKSVFAKATQIIDRQPIRHPLVTGIKVIDATLPIGRGQRELIIGDRKLGKTTLATDIVLNQRFADPPVMCVYVLCGQKRSYVEEVVELLTANRALAFTTVVAATADDAYAEQYLAPLIGTTIAEHFRDQGRDALIIYDDLSKHAKAYRDIALLLKRPPGREAYPGDIFSLHASLLERAAMLSAANRGGSLTALPIIETQEGDITSYIPTNLISITDGQIYLERALYQKAILPAVNVELSVSRVGSEAQTPLLKEVTQGLRLALAQYKELQRLMQLESSMSEESTKSIARGKLTTELLKQEKHTCITWEEQVVLFYALHAGLFDRIPKEDWTQHEQILLDLLRYGYPKILKQIGSGSLNATVKTSIQKWVNDFCETFLPSLT